MCKRISNIIVIIFFLIIALSDQRGEAQTRAAFQYAHGAIIRGDQAKKELALVFTGDEFADGGEYIQLVLKKYAVKASFFLTGKFYRHPDFQQIIISLRNDGHYLGGHSDQHLLYCAWENRDSLLVTKEQFIADLQANYAAMAAFGIEKNDARFFLPPYEYYNTQIANWTKESGLTLVNFTPGTISHTDWAYPGLGKMYHPSKEIWENIINFERSQATGLNGFILLCHIGCDSRREDKFYVYLDQLIPWLINSGYEFKRIDELLN